MCRSTRQLNISLPHATAVRRLTFGLALQGAPVSVTTATEDMAQWIANVADGVALLQCADHCFRLANHGRRQQQGNRQKDLRRKDQRKVRERQSRQNCRFESIHLQSILPES